MLDLPYKLYNDRSPSVNYFFYCLNKGSSIPMDKMERFFKIDQILKSSRYSVPKSRFLEELEVSLATWKRDLEYLRDRMHAPIEYDKKTKGYQYTEGSDFELPGLWMNEGEIHALLTMQHLVENLQPGMLDDHIKPLIDRITGLIELGEHTSSEVNKRIRILSLAGRPFNNAYFEMISSAVLGRKRLSIKYYDRTNDIETIREVSPQRLIHYRENWYMDAWCHLRDGLRTFAIESVREAETLATKAKNISDDKLNEELGSGYGIFTGSTTSKAQLRFNPKTARWVDSEQWHPVQVSHYDDDGYYHLTFPYSDDRELIQDILKFGANVEVIKPPELKERVHQALLDAVNIYTE